MFALVAACGSGSDETSRQVEEVVRTAAGNPAVRVWDIKVCRDDQSKAPLNAVGLVGGGKGPRAWYVEWKDGQLSDNVDIEYETSDPGITAYYNHFRNARAGQTNCRNIKADAFGTGPMQLPGFTGQVQPPPTDTDVGPSRFH